MKPTSHLIITAILGSILSIFPAAHAQTTAFTYQGKLNDGTAPAQGTYDLRFTIYDNSNDGNALGAITNAPTSVSNGLFTVQLDFGGTVFDGSARWMEIGVRTNGDSGDYSLLDPRQPITSTPYAIQSANAETAATATVAVTANAVAATNISGRISDVQLSTNVALLTASNVTFSGAIHAPNVVSSTAPARWTNQIFGWGGNTCQQVPLPTQTNLVAVSFGRFNGAGIREDSTVAVWGFAGGINNPPAGLSNVVAVSVGSWHMLALKSNGTVVSWGEQTSVPAGVTNIVAISAGALHSLAIKADGTVLAWGGNDYGQRNVPAGLSNVVAVSAGYYHSMALKADGTVVGWGTLPPFWNNNIAGLSNVVAVSAGVEVSLALKADGKVVVAGINANPFTQIFAGLDCVAIAAGDTHAMAMTRDGQLVKAGSISTLFPMPPAVTNFPMAITEIGAGYDYSAVFFKNLSRQSVVFNNATNTSLAGAFRGNFRGTFTGNGSLLTNVNALTLNGLPSSAFGMVSNHNDWRGVNYFRWHMIADRSGYFRSDPTTVEGEGYGSVVRVWFDPNTSSGQVASYNYTGYSGGQSTFAPRNLVLQGPGGSVGIGTTPTAALDVRGDVKFSGVISGDGSGLTNLAVSINSSELTNVNAAQLNGLTSSAFLGATGKAADADKLDDIDSTQFARKDVAETFAGAVTTARLVAGETNVMGSTTFTNHVRINGPRTLEFGAGVAGKEGNAGKIGYGTFSADALDVVGAGSSGSQRKIRFYAEGGSTFLGNVGLNSLNPQARLEVAAGAGHDGASDQKAIALAYQSGGFRHWIRSRHNGGFLGSGNAIDFFLNNSTDSEGSSGPGTNNLLTLTLDSGKAGIGTMSPGDKLSIKGGALSFHHPGDVPYVGMDFDSANDSLRLRGNVGATFLNTDYLAIRRVTGNVGIGTTNPTARLEVAGNLKVTGNIEGNGSNLSSLNASQLTSGVIPRSALPDFQGPAYQTIGGGSQNSSSANYATVAGGLQNTASGNAASVGGGSTNYAVGVGATVPGGVNNSAIGNYSFASGRRAKAVHDGSMVLADATDEDIYSTEANQFVLRALGGVQMLATNGVQIITGFEAGGTVGVYLSPGSSGWGVISDRNRKENFSEVNTREVLDKVAALPITTWNYKTQDRSVRHMGPVAQDFHAAFGLGEDEKRIVTVDADGVALAAIQGLNEKLEQALKQKDAKITKLEQEAAKVSSLEKRVAELERLLQQLAAK